jgi:TolA-binding protein
MRNRKNKIRATGDNHLRLRFVAVILAVIIFVGAFFVNSFAQQDQEQLSSFVQTQNAAAAKVFSEGRDLIGEEDWKKAEGKFKNFISAYPKEKNLDAALYWLAFTQVKQEKCD